ncbi:wHTH domain-containing protein [Streptomyces griseoruber]|uniref:wHTH domain-containing protein n=1 Tax=Streptomyces griseoruber TaxID=1943 RepID=UPI00379A6E97
MAQWRTQVAGSLVWELISPDARERSKHLQDEARELADRLADSYAESRRSALLDDPWHDERLASRTAARTNLLIHKLWSDREGFLSPSEAALIALLPFLHQAHRSATAVELAHVGPTDLRRRSAADADRQAYELVLGSHERLVRRAELGDLDDRPDGRPEIGWWLFHQWARTRQGSRLAHPADLDTVAVLLEPELLSRLLSCASARPSDLFDPALAGHLPSDPFPLDFHGRDFQSVRERLVGPLFAVAHAMAVEVTDLSSVIVRHVGIPEALDTERLQATVNSATWLFGTDDLGLKATCDHPAVVAALSEHTRRLESLLRTVRASGTPELAALPLHTRAEGVHEVDGRGARVPVDRLVRFRLDEERVQELLMGENLYRDRSLAIRELYQNALDACRYRRARSLAADESSGYRGRIEFRQGYDETEGRHYLECRDNGVGMDELTLSEVFAQAGVRFTDLPRYQEERQEWQRRGVTMHPNSRFGIGVLSYFMLADEVRVTTCHMDRLNGRFRELTVLITGPGHYFRVRPTEASGTIGTTVRLYLRDGDKAPSCVRELRRLLGVAEFTTTALHGSRSVEWKPGVLRPREDLTSNRDGYEAHGCTASWSDGPQGVDGQVVWCEHGGGVLVDGIHTETRVLKGILSDPKGTGRLRGAVVNLAGATRPRRLSVDRTEVLDDVGADVERLIRAALPTLLSSQPALLTHTWLSAVADRSPRLADIVTEAGGAAGRVLDLRGIASEMAVAGHFPHDVHILHGTDLGGYRGDVPDEMEDPADDVTRLWRLLAHRPHPMLTALAELVPELNEVERVLPARPSDARIRSSRATPGYVLSLAEACGASYGSVVRRLTELRLPTPPVPECEPVVDDINLTLLSPLRDVVPPGHLLRAHFEFGIGVSEAARRLEVFGFVTPDLHPSVDDADEQVLRLLSDDLNGTGSWLTTAETVAPGHLVKAHLRLGIAVDTAAQWLRRFGLTVLDVPTTDTPPADTLRLLSNGPDTERPLAPSLPVPVRHVFAVAAEWDRPVPEVTRELRAHGFRIAGHPVLEQLTDDVLAKSREWGWERSDWEVLCHEETVPPGLLVLAARRRGEPLADTAHLVSSLGLTPPAPLPEHAEDTDMSVLTAPVREGGRRRWLGANSRVSPRHVAEVALETGLSPAAVASRLRAYGLLPPDAPFPEEAAPSDAILLRPSQIWPGNPRPLQTVMQLSRQLDMPRSAVLHRMRQYGVPVKGEVSPETLDSVDPYLLERSAHRHGGRRVFEEPLPLHRLVKAAVGLEMEWPEAVRQLRSLGFVIRGDHTTALDAVDLELCLGDLDREQGSSRRRAPIPHYLRLTESYPGPVADLVARLERLGVDLDPVREAVRASLPRVPGLVMRAAADAT